MKTGYAVAAVKTWVYIKSPAFAKSPSRLASSVVIDLSIY